MQVRSERSIRFPEAPAAAGAALAKSPDRPDICLLAGMKGASNQISAELRTIGEEANYESALRVLKTQGALIAELAGELLKRFEEDSQQ